MFFKNISEKLSRIFQSKAKIDNEFLNELHDILISSDVSVKTTQKLLEKTKRDFEKQSDTSPDVFKQFLMSNIKNLFLNDKRQNTEVSQNPHVIMMVGVNGTGKTTAVAKLAHYYHEQGKKVVVVAADTFRAAATEQLSVWAKRMNVEIVTSDKEGADPAAVVFKALDFAKLHHCELVIVDTAGRLHTKVNLMKELEKIKRIILKHVNESDLEILLSLDATIGQNGLRQAEEFHKSLNLTGIILNKMDGTAKGGGIISIANDYNIPIQFVGVGEKMTDLKPFDKTEFVNALFGM